MSFVRLINAQGIAGLAASIALAILLLVQAGETRHWKKESGRFEQLYRGEQAAFATTVANYRAAADAARAADAANSERVAAQQRTINERTSHDFETRLAAARAAAERLRLDSEGASHSGAGGGAPVPVLPASAASAPQAAGEDRLPEADRLTATEQAIQLDELIRWVKAQAAVDPGGKEK
jgi:signal transduction histidine kinase